jgi:hypothetical protein
MSIQQETTNHGVISVFEENCIFALKMAGSGNENGRELPRIWPARRSASRKIQTITTLLPQLRSY